MVRGIERTQIFRDDTDRADFLARLAALVEAGAWTLYACKKGRSALMKHMA
jgi:hypothetical protein